MLKKIFICFSLFIIIVTPLIPSEVDANSVRRGDQEIRKSSSKIRSEIDLQTEKFDTHGVRKIEDGKGKFYDAYKDEFDELEEKVAGGKVFVELMKKLDYNAGEFKCGKLEPVCHIVNFLYITGTSMINFLLAPLEKLAIEPEGIVNDSTLNKFKNGFKGFTYSLLALFLLFQIIKIYSFRLTNHSDTINVMNEKVIKLIVAAVLIFSYDQLFRLILNIQYRINYSIFSYLTNTQEVTNNLMLNVLLTPHGNIFVAFILLYAVLLAILFFQMTYTFAMAALYYTVGPVAIASMVNDDYNMFSIWLKTIISRFLTLAMQGLCVILCFSFATKIDWIFDGFDIMNNTFSKIISISFLLVGIALPSLLKDFGNSSGSGRGAVSATQSVTRIFTRS